MNQPTIKFKLLDKLAVVPVPAHGYQEDAGADLRSVEFCRLPNGETTAIRTGLAIELPPGYEAQIRTRSGMALKGIVVANSPATIDPGYRGEICVILANRSRVGWEVKVGDRIAQLVIAKYESPVWEAAELSVSLRGEGGYGSTGK